MKKCTFQPKINTISEQIAFEKGYQEGNLNIDVTNRLMIDAEQRRELQSMENLRKKEEEIAKICTF